MRPASRAGRRSGLGRNRRKGALGFACCTRWAARYSRAAPAKGGASAAAMRRFLSAAISARLVRRSPSEGCHSNLGV